MVKDVTSILEQCLALGFRSATSDRGHLLFSAWNAMGNSTLWTRGGDRSKTNGLDSLMASLRMSTKEETEMELSRILLEIREEICRLYIDMNTHTHGGQPVVLPLALKLAQAKDRSSATSTQIKKNLKSVVNIGEKLLSVLLDTEDPSPALFSNIEAVAIYITFGIASQTKPGNDAFSESHIIEQRKRPRGYSSESERGDPSDLDSVESDSDEDDADTRLRERLRNACAEFGAAPTHPDWLDEHCRLQFGIASSEALDVARTAVRALTKLLATGYARHKKSLQAAVDLLLKARKGKYDRNHAVLARKILVLVTRYDSTCRGPSSRLYDPKEDFEGEKKNLLASLGDFAMASLEYFTSRRASENLEEAKTAWCPK